jgi:hypothetical protein
MPTVRVSQEAIEFRSAFLGSRDSYVHKFAGVCPPAALTIFAQLQQLDLRVLAVVGRRDPSIKSYLNRGMF